MGLFYISPSFLLLECQFNEFVFVFSVGVMPHTIFICANHLISCIFLLMESCCNGLFIVPLWTSLSRLGLGTVLNCPSISLNISYFMANGVKVVDVFWSYFQNVIHSIFEKIFLKFYRITILRNIHFVGLLDWSTLLFQVESPSICFGQICKTVLYVFVDKVEY